MQKQTWRQVQRWTATEARAALDAFAKSGLSGTAFAEQHGIDSQRLYWWRKRLGLDECGSSVRAPRFVAVEVTRGADVSEEAGLRTELAVADDEERRGGASRSAAAMVVVVDNGLRVEVEPGFETSALRRLIDVIRSC